MSSYKPAYRARMYAPRSTDPAEATVLTPAAGAAHSDEFKIATISGVTGYQPYMMGRPSGRRGRIDYKTRKLDVGAMTVQLIDKKLSTTNLSRWWSAFFGDAKGKPHGRLKFQIDESLDGGTTWATYATMEVVKTTVAKNLITLNLRDRVETLKMRCFIGQAHASITYLAQPTLMPVGFRGSAYGKLKTTPPLTGTTKELIAGGAPDYAPTGEIQVMLDAASVRAEGNVVTQNLLQTIAPDTVEDVLSIGGRPIIARMPNFSGTLRCRLKQTSGGAIGTTGEYKVGLVGYAQETKNGRRHFRLIGFCIEALDSTDVNYAAVPAVNVTCEFTLYCDGEASEATPILIGDVDPAQYIIDLCGGKFSALYRFPETLPTGKAYGDVKRAVAVNTSTGTTGCVSDLVGTGRPSRRDIVKKSSTVIEEIERVCLENNWAPYLDASGQVNVASLELPSSTAGIGTISDDDTDTEHDIAWEHDPTSAIWAVKAAYYGERIITPTELWQLAEEVPTLPSHGPVIETKHPLDIIYIGSVDFGEDVLTLDARGYRAQDGEELQGQARTVYVRNKLIELANSFARPYGYGLTTVPIICRRTSNVTALSIGKLVFSTITQLPNPGDRARGGTQLLRVLEVTEQDDRIQLRCIFLAAQTVAAAPTLTAPALETGNVSTGVTTSVTRNAAGHPVQVRYAVTETSVGTVPADTSPLWAMAARADRNGTVKIRNVPAGKRVWVQGRSFPVDATSLVFPSPWTNAGGTGYVDTTALSAPSVLAAASVTDKTALLTWTNGSANLATEILIATPTTDARQRIFVVPPGGNRFELNDLTPSTTYRVEVRHLMGQTPSAGVTADFTTAASGATTGATPLLLEVYLGS